jgi:hypothetical protein
MDALEQSDELLRRGGELRARSMRACAAADATMEKSRQLLVATAKAQKAVMHAYGLESTGPRRKVTVEDLPAGQ